jgi:hypothetical protein
MMKATSGLSMLLLSLSLAACGLNRAVKAAGDMPGKIEETNQQIKSTNEGVRMQTLNTALSNMYAPENTEHLSPAVRMFTYAQAFAQAAHTDELVELTHETLAEIANLGSNENLDAAGKAALDHEKQARLQGMEAIAGLTPQDKVSQIIAEQISNGGGVYQDDACAFLVLRALYIKTVTFDGDISTKSISNVSFLQNAVTQAEDLQYITSLPFQSLLTVTLSGFNDADLNGTLTVDTTSSHDVWQSLYDSALKASTSTHSLPAGTNQARYNQLVAEIKGHLKK